MVTGNIHQDVSYDNAFLCSIMADSSVSSSSVSVRAVQTAIETSEVQPRQDEKAAAAECNGVRISDAHAAGRVLRGECFEWLH